MKLCDYVAIASRIARAIHCEVRRASPEERETILEFASSLLAAHEAAGGAEKGREEVRPNYILRGKETVPVNDVTEWARWYETGNRRVAETKVGESRISTVFLGLDHQWGYGPPLLFETMVFGGPLDQEMDRYSTWDEAEAGHADMVRRVREAKQPPATANG